MRICAVTGSRADWGLLRPVLEALRNRGCPPLVVVTGSHLEPAFGMTVDEIGQDGFTPDATVPLGAVADGTLSMVERTGEAVGGIGRALAALAPDLVLVLGDRYEILAAALAAHLLRIPLAHIAGGDISEGAVDDAMRHAITKLAHLHFVTNSPARSRVLQMGEPADRVFDCGSPGIDAILSVPRWDRSHLERVLGFRLRTRNLAITYHPATLDPAEPEAQVGALLEALERLGPDCGLVFTGANADAGGARINARLEAFVAAHENACLAVSLGHAGYYSLVAQADLVVGNSSSGLYEAPALGTPTLDVGIRQQGRLRGPSVRQVANDADAIAEAIRAMLADPPTDFSSPYGQGSAAPCIAERLLAIAQPRDLLVKRFHETRR